VAKVLIADASWANRKDIGTALGRLGHEVIEAADGFEALRRCIADRPDALLLQMELPGCTGLDVLDTLADVQHAPIVIAMVADWDGPARNQAPRFGARAVVKSPPNADRLVQALHAALDLGSALVG